MCSRECYSVSRGGLIAGLLVFLAAFLVGVAAVDGIEAIFLPEAAIANLRKSVEPIEVQRHTWQKDFGPLEITYDCSSTEGDQTRVFFTATNVGAEPAYFDLTITGRLTAHIFDLPRTKHQIVAAKITAKELAPGKSENISALMPLGAKVSEYSFAYNSGPMHRNNNAVNFAGAGFWTCLNSNLPE